MAKKKLSNSKQAKQASTAVPVDPSQHLRTLNSILLNETAALRQRVHSLCSHLTRASLDVQVLLHWTSLLLDESIESGVRQTVERTVLSHALRELVAGAERDKQGFNKKLERFQAEKEKLKADSDAEKAKSKVNIGEVLKGKDRLLYKRDLDSRDEEVRLLKLKVEELRKTNADFMEEASRMRLDLELHYDLKRENSEKQSPAQVMEGLEGKLASCEREIENLQMIKSDQEAKIAEVEKMASNYSSTMSVLEGQLVEERAQHQEELSRVLNETYAILEDLNTLSQQDESRRLEAVNLEEITTKGGQELDQLLAKCNSLLEEQEQIERSFGIEAIAGEKKEETEKQSVEKAAKSDVQYKELVQKNNQLEDDIIHLKDIHESVLREKNRLGKELDIQKKKAERDLQISERELGNAEMVLQRAFWILKKAAEDMGRASSERENVNGAEIVSEVGAKAAPFMVELEAIKSAFAARDIKLGGLNTTLSSPHVLVAQSQRMNLWTLLYFAIFLAAASVAYFTNAR